MLSFLVLFYIYPLKFLFNLLVNVRFAGSLNEIIRVDQLPILLIIYSCGFLAVFLVFLLMTLNVIRRRQWLELSDLEMVEVRREVCSHSIMIVTALLSIGLALILPPAVGAASAGWIYCLIGPAQFWVARVFAKRKEAMRSTQVGNRSEQQPLIKGSTDDQEDR